MVERILYAVACVFLPVGWGILVNWIFNLWRSQPTRSDKGDHDSVFPDYQI